MSSRTYLSIGDVLTLLREEFPDVTISKIRFLESQGLVNPERSPSGYRKFFEADVERLRWVLRQQREHFLPLKVIRDRLDAGDLSEGAVGEPVRRRVGARGVVRSWPDQRQGPGAGPCGGRSRSLRAQPLRGPRGNGHGGPDRGTDARAVDAGRRRGHGADIGRRISPGGARARERSSTRAAPGGARSRCPALGRPHRRPECATRNMTRPLSEQRRPPAPKACGRIPTRRTRRGLRPRTAGAATVSRGAAGGGPEQQHASTRAAITAPAAAEPAPTASQAPAPASTRRARHDSGGARCRRFGASGPAECRRQRCCRSHCAGCSRARSGRGRRWAERRVPMSDGRAPRTSGQVEPGAQAGRPGPGRRGPGRPGRPVIGPAAQRGRTRHRRRAWSPGPA